MSPTACWRRWSGPATPTRTPASSSPGPNVLTHREVVEIALRAAGRRRRLLPLPPPLLRPLLRGYETLTGPAALATWDEAELLAVTMRTPRGTADAESLGVRPQALRAVLGV